MTVGGRRRRRRRLKYSRVSLKCYFSTCDLTHNTSCTTSHPKLAKQPSSSSPSIHSQILEITWIIIYGWLSKQTTKAYSPWTELGFWAESWVTTKSSPKINSKRRAHIICIRTNAQAKELSNAAVNYFHFSPTTTLSSSSSATPHLPQTTHLQLLPFINHQNHNWMKWK